MKKILAAILLFASSLFAQGNKNIPDEPKAYMLVRMVDGASLASVASGLAKQHGFDVEVKLSIVPAFRAKLGPRQMIELQRSPFVAAVEPDGPVYPMVQTIPYGIAAVGAMEGSQKAGDGTGQVDGVKLFILDTATSWEQNSDLRGSGSGFCAPTFCGGEPPPPPPPPSSLTGTVTSSAGGTIVDVVVELKGTHQRTSSDLAGVYKFGFVSPGTYEVGFLLLRSYAYATASVLIEAGKTTVLDQELLFCAEGAAGRSSKCQKTGGRAFEEALLPESDCQGHATHVAGTAGAMDNDQLVVGVAPGVELIALAVFAPCTSSGSWTDVIAALEWVVTNGPGKGVLNLSLGGAKNDTADAAIRATRDAGYTIVVAAGNNAGNACLLSPANQGGGVDNGIITVAATDSTGAEASFSSFGPCVDVWAPGVSVESTCNTGGLCVKSGTSMSSPHGAGAIAHLLSLGDQTPTALEAAMRAARIPAGRLSKDGTAIQLLHIAW